MNRILVVFCVNDTNLGLRNDVLQFVHLSCEKIYIFNNNKINNNNFTYTIQHSNKIKVTAATTPHPHTLTPLLRMPKPCTGEQRSSIGSHSKRLSIWYKMVVACDLLHPIWMARLAASHKKDCCASMPQHPYDFTARGMHTHPCSAHLESLTLCF